jgi:hypothetical protein
MHQETNSGAVWYHPATLMWASPCRSRARTSPLAWVGVSLLLACASSSATGPATSSIEPTPVADPETPADGSEPCRHAVTGDSPIARACRRGGIAAAKTTMKDLVKEGRTAGLKLACDDCHLDTADFSRLAPEAPDRLRNLLDRLARR